MTDDEFRDLRPRRGARVRIATRPRATSGKTFERRSRFAVADADDPTASLAAVAAGGARRSAGRVATTLPPRRAARRVARADRDARLDADSTRTRASSARSPSASTSPRRANSTPRSRSSFDEIPGLSHRPLPRQGVDRQHPRAALREPPLRADLESRPRQRSSRSTCPRRSRSRVAASFYEETGAFRDMVVTHLFQVLGFVAMEQPTSLDARPLRDEMHKVFETIRPIDPAHVVRGQYDGYRDEPGVAPTSETETFVALRAEVENTRWKGVPFYLRTGKCLAQSRQVVTIGFDEPVMRLFPLEPQRPQVARQQARGRLRRPRIDPRPLPRQAARPANAPRFGRDDLPLRRLVPDREPPRGLRAPDPRGDARQPVALHAVRRYRALWEVAAPLLESPPPVERYEKGSWGPESINRVIAPNQWCLPQ